MKLTLADANQIDNPDDEAIARALRTIDGEDNNFAILSVDDLTYIQTEGGPSRGFVLEYQEGSMARHYRAQDQALSVDSIIEAFRAYASSDPTWKDRFQWETDESSAGGCLPVLVICLLGVVRSVV